MEMNHLISSSIGHFCAWHSKILLPHTNLISFVQRGYVSQPCIKDQPEMTGLVEKFHSFFFVKIENFVAWLEVIFYAEKFMHMLNFPQM